MLLTKQQQDQLLSKGNPFIKRPWIQTNDLILIRPFINVADIIDQFPDNLNNQTNKFQQQYTITQVRQWLIDVYEVIISDTFEKLKLQHLSTQLSSGFFSKNVIANIIYIFRKMTKLDIAKKKKIIKFMGQQSKKIIKQLLQKYPENVNIQKFRCSDLIQIKTDLLRSGQFDPFHDILAGIHFFSKQKQRQKNYIPQIMRVVNRTIQIPFNKTKKSKGSNYKGNFQGFVELITLISKTVVKGDQACGNFIKKIENIKTEIQAINKKSIAKKSEKIHEYLDILIFLIQKQPIKGQFQQKKIIQDFKILKIKEGGGQDQFIKNVHNLQKSIKTKLNDVQSQRQLQIRQSIIYPSCIQQFEKGIRKIINLKQGQGQEAFEYICNILYRIWHMNPKKPNSFVYYQLDRQLSSINLFTQWQIKQLQNAQSQTRQDIFKIIQNSKIDSRARPFTEQQIKREDLQINDYSIYNFLVRWIDQLTKIFYLNFQSLANDIIFFNSKQPGQQVKLNRKQVKILYQAVQFHKLQFEKIKEQFQEQNDLILTTLVQKDISSCYLNSIQASINNLVLKNSLNVDFYMFIYINQIIKILVKIPQTAFEIEKFQANRKDIKNQYEKLNLLNYNIPHHFRVQIYGKQQNILQLLHFLNKISDKQDYLKVLRSKERKQDVNYIELIVLIKGLVMGQIRLKVNSQLNHLQSIYQKFNYQIYRFSKFQFLNVISNINRIYAGENYRLQIKKSLKISNLQQGLTYKKLQANRTNRKKHQTISIPFFCQNSHCGKFQTHYNMNYLNFSQINEIKKLDSLFTTYINQLQKQKVLTLIQLQCCNSCIQKLLLEKLKSKCFQQWDSVFALLLFISSKQNMKQVAKTQKVSSSESVTMQLNSSGQQSDSNRISELSSVIKNLGFLKYFTIQSIIQNAIKIQQSYEDQIKAIQKNTNYSPQYKIIQTYKKNQQFKREIKHYFLQQFPSTGIIISKQTAYPQFLHFYLLQGQLQQNLIFKGEQSIHIIALKNKIDKNGIDAQEDIQIVLSLSCQKIYEYKDKFDKYYIFKHEDTEKQKIDLLHNIQNNQLTKQQKCLNTICKFSVTLKSQISSENLKKKLQQLKKITNQKFLNQFKKQQLACLNLQNRQLTDQMFRNHQISSNTEIVILRENYIQDIKKVFDLRVNQQWEKHNQAKIQVFDLKKNQQQGKHNQSKIQVLDLQKNYKLQKSSIQQIQKFQKLQKLYLRGTLKNMDDEAREECLKILFKSSSMLKLSLLQLQDNNISGKNIKTVSQEKNSNQIQECKKKIRYLDLSQNFLVKQQQSQQFKFLKLNIPVLKKLEVLKMYACNVKIDQGINYFKSLKELDLSTKTEFFENQDQSLQALNIIQGLTELNIENRLSFPVQTIVDTLKKNKVKIANVAGTKLQKKIIQGRKQKNKVKIANIASTKLQKKIIQGTKQKNIIQQLQKKIIQLKEKNEIQQLQKKIIQLKEKNEIQQLQKKIIQLKEKNDEIQQLKKKIIQLKEKNEIYFQQYQQHSDSQQQSIIIKFMQDKKMKQQKVFWK